MVSIQTDPGFAEIAQPPSPWLSHQITLNSAQITQRGAAATELPTKAFYRRFRGRRGWFHYTAFIRDISAIRGQKILYDEIFAGKQPVQG